MIIDIPNKEDFFNSADHMVNEAWEKIASLAHSYYEMQCQNNFYEFSENFSNDHVLHLDKYWEFARPKLISALTLVLQSVEFRIKGLIVEISPYLLLSSSSRNIPKADDKGLISFTQFHTIDAQDLIKVYETFSERSLSSKFKKWFEGTRVLRNKFMHTVDLSSDISPEFIFKCIVYAHNELNKNDPHWIMHRYKYKAEHSHGGIGNLHDATPGLIFEILNVHYELTGAIYVCSRQVANEIFGFDSELESDFCKKCISVMSQSEWFDSKHIDYCIGTVQKQKRTQLYQCIFCNTEYENLPESLYDEE